MTARIKIVGTSQATTVSATSVQSAPITGNAPDRASAVKLNSTVDAFVEIGTNPVAIAGDSSSINTSMFIAAGTDYYLRILDGDQVAVIRETGDGFLYITPIAA